MVEVGGLRLSVSEIGGPTPIRDFHDRVFVRSYGFSVLFRAGSDPKH